MMEGKGGRVKVKFDKKKESQFFLSLNLTKFDIPLVTILGDGYFEFATKTCYHGPLEGPDKEGEPPNKLAILPS